MARPKVYGSFGRVEDTYAVRVDKNTTQQLEKIHNRLQANAPYATVTMADVLRCVISEGIANHT